MLSERQRKFRDNYKAEISPLYSGLLHVGITFGAGIAAIYYCVSQTAGASWEWLLVLPVFLAGNFVEWFMHRHVMHRRIDVFALRAIYERHTRQHHQYFTDNEATIDTTREFRIVFFPWRVLITLGVFGVLLGWLTTQVLNANAGYIVFSTMWRNTSSTRCSTTAATCTTTGSCATRRSSTRSGVITPRITTRES